MLPANGGSPRSKQIEKQRFFMHFGGTDVGLATCGLLGMQGPFLGHPLLAK